MSKLTGDPPPKDTLPPALDPRTGPHPGTAPRKRLRLACISFGILLTGLFFSLLCFGLGPLTGAAPAEAEKDKKERRLELGKVEFPDGECIVLRVQFRPKKDKKEQPPKTLFQNRDLINPMPAPGSTAMVTNASGTTSGTITASANSRDSMGNVPSMVQAKVFTMQPSTLYPIPMDAQSSDNPPATTTGAWRISKLNSANCGQPPMLPLNWIVVWETYPDHSSIATMYGFYGQCINK